MDKQTSQIVKTDYDAANYDYQEYWKDRDYENLAEKRFLSELFPKYANKDKVFVDVGGAFGRLEEISTKYFKKRIILDYSLLNLQNCTSDAMLVQADAYDMPFIDNSVDQIVCVRVSHHLEKQEKFISEVYRILNSNGIFIYEIANKFHFKAILKNLFKLNFKFFNSEPYQQSAGTTTYFQNYSLSEILKLTTKAGFELVEKYSIENFRSGPNGFSQKNPKLWLSLDKIFSPIFNILNFGPSIYLVLKKSELGNSETKNLELQEIFKTEPIAIKGKVLVYRKD